MSRAQIYDRLKALALAKRDEHGITTASMGLSAVRSVYKAEGITLDLWRHKLKKVRAAYFVIDGESRVLVNARLPEAPRLFAQCHELKHHYVDRAVAEDVAFACQDFAWHEAPVREIGAEVFAAEFIYPEAEFLSDLAAKGITSDHCSVELVVAFKREVPVPISYQFIVKRLEWCSIVPRGQFAGIQWNKREEEIYGLPVYKRIQRYRSRLVATRS